MTTQFESGLGEANQEIDWLGILLTILDNLKLIIFLPVLSAVLTLAYSYTITPTYVASTTLLPPGTAAGAGGSNMLLGQISASLGISNGGFRTPTDEYLAYFGSVAIQDIVIDKLQLQKHFGTDNQDQLRNKLRAAVKVTIEKKSGLILIEASDVEPKFAAQLANTYAQALSQIKGDMSLKEARDRRLRLEKELSEAYQVVYQTPAVRETVIQSLVREYELARVDQRRQGPFVAQLDEAQVPQFKSKPKRFEMVLAVAVITWLLVLVFIFIRKYLSQFLSRHAADKKTILNSIRQQFKF